MIARKLECLYSFYQFVTDNIIIIAGIWHVLYIFGAYLSIIIKLDDFITYKMSYICILMFIYTLPIILYFIFIKNPSVSSKIIIFTLLLDIMIPSHMLFHPALVDYKIAIWNMMLNKYNYWTNIIGSFVWYIFKYKKNMFTCILWVVGKPYLCL